MEKIDKIKLCTLYNMSDIEELKYMLPFCKGENRTLCERLIYLNEETQLGWGKEEYTGEEGEEYFNGKWKLLKYFGIDNYKGSGDAVVDGKMY